MPDELRTLRTDYEALQKQLRESLARVEQLEKENRQLREQLEQAQRQAARQAAPFRREVRQKVPQDQKKRPGRSAGHPGFHRAVPATIDETVELPLEQCPHCGGPVDQCQRLEQIIEEIPPVRPHVVKVISYRGRCGHCGGVQTTHPLQSSHSRGAAKVQLGPRALALAALLNKVHGLTMRKSCQVLKDLAGLRITPGGLSQALDRVAGRVEGLYGALIEQLRHSPAVHADETSWWVGGPSWWLWVFTTPQATVYRVDESRGSDVVREVLSDEFEGMLVSDCLSSYDPSAYRKHKCISHHLRAIAKAAQLPGQKDPEYLQSWRSFFHGVLALYKLREIVSDEQFQRTCDKMECWRDRLLSQPAGQSGDERIRKRLFKQRNHLLGCLYEPAAEPTNNRAERALRPAVIARKLSCGNKTPHGRDTWQILASLGATYHQQAKDFIQYLASHLSLAPAPG
jgi:transposase